MASRFYSISPPLRNCCGEVNYKIVPRPVTFGVDFECFFVSGDRLIKLPEVLVDLP